MSLLNKIASFLLPQKYDFDSIEGIRAIPIPKYPPINGMASPTNNIEYILQRKATEHKKNGRMDLAIECLRKSNEIMPHSNFRWSAKDYLRLISYLKKDRQFEEADREEQKLREALPSVFNSASAQMGRIKAAHGYDLVIFSTHYPTCSECAKYQGRVFSISGKDSRFPKLPDHIRKNGCIHEGCRHMEFTYVDELKTKKEIQEDMILSNAPFVDNRSEEERALWEKQRKEELEFIKDQEVYDKLVRFLPEFAPKSFGGYRRMKNAQSKNFLKLVEEAKRMGIDIE